MTEVDAVVVGGGPAGLASALWLARYRRSVVVLDSGQYRSAAVERSHGYLGRDPQKPLDLLARGREELLAYPTASVLPVRATEVAAEDGRFAVGDLRARRLVLACGVEDAFPEVGGFAEHYGASVFHCPSCDGYEARDRDVVTLGWDPHLVGFAGTLLNWARSVTVVTAGHRFAGDEACRRTLQELGIELVEDVAASFVGSRGDLRGLRLGSGRELPASLAFFSVAHRPRVELAVALGCRLDEDGYVAVDGCGETSVPGVYAAGDLTPGLQLVSVAAASGVVAGVAAAQSLFGERGALSPDPSPLPL
ncbi:MAG: NAD(P)/FAD-dependent oxidoreductase [Nocardioidaceae bacterium]